MDLAATGCTWWCVDCEFIRPDGDLTTPVCLVAVEAVSRREVRLWADDLAALAVPPFPVDRSAVVVAYMGTAEMSCFRALHWPMPTYLLDLYPEFVRIVNNRPPPGGFGLLSTLTYFGLPSIAAADKDRWRERILAGPPYSDAERAGILDYCASDVYALVDLLPHILPLL